jgi:hypothetical protein
MIAEQSNAVKVLFHTVRAKKRLCAFLDYEAQMRYPEALTRYQQTLRMHEQVLDPAHPDTAETRERYTNLMKEIEITDVLMPSDIQIRIDSIE